MGGIKYPALANLAKELWQWCEARNIWFFASFINSSDNVIADKQSRITSVETEYSLNSSVFQNIVHKFGFPVIDLFASHLNHKCKMFVSWKRDPDSIAVDAFTIDWGRGYFYAFPPFAVIAKVLNKIIYDKAQGILVVPDWKTQSWYPLFLMLLKSPPLIITPSKDLLLSPFNCRHPLWRSLTLVAGSVSGKLF